MDTLEGNSYPLPRGASESERLNAQHHCWISALGFHIHPHIAKTLPDDATIADVATGTGIWLTDLAAKTSLNRHLEGLDISNVQFPASHPQNVTFDQLNILQPVPEKYIGRYDLIHIRLIMAGMLKDDWAVAASHVLQMLKPGGWVQWEEFDAANIKVVLGEPAAKSTAIDTIRHQGIAANVSAGRVTDAPLRLASIFADVGFSYTKREMYSSDRTPAFREKYTQVTMRALTGTIGYYIQQGADGVMSAEDLAKYTEEALVEIEGGKVYLQGFIYCSIGRKPCLEDV